MNRRGFLRMLGTGAAIGGVAAVAPSQVWPFRKIFLPLFSRIDMLDARLWGRAPYPGPLFEGLEYSPLAHIHALEMEAFAKEIPDLVYRQNSLHAAIRRKQAIYHDLIGGHQFRVPMRVEAVDPTNADHVKCAEAATKVLNMANGNKIRYVDEIANVAYVGPTLEPVNLAQMDADHRWFWEEGIHGIGYVQGDMSMGNLNRSEIIAGSLNEKPAYKLRRAARRFVDSLKVSNEDMGWDG